MADLLNIDMSAGDVIDALGDFAEDNNLTPSPALSTEMDAEDFASSVNGMLDTDVAASDSATTAIGKINTAVDGYSPTPVEPDVELAPFKFLHISDTHGWGPSVNTAKAMMDSNSDLEFTAITGDVLMYAGSDNLGNNRTNVINSIKQKLLAVTGNHDLSDTEYLYILGVQGVGSYDCKYARQRWQSWLTGEGTMNVSFGNSTNYEGENSPRGCYWHKDFVLKDTDGENTSSKLRVIGLDQYDYYPSNDNKHIPNLKRQLDWFVGLLDDLNANDCFMVMLHEPPQSVTAQSTRRLNSWCSSRLYTWDNSTYSGRGMWHAVIDAYSGGETLDIDTEERDNPFYNTSANHPVVKITHNFSNSKKAKFLCYLCGHLHNDYVGYSGNLLIIDIDCAFNSGGGGSDIRYQDTSPDRIAFSDISAYTVMNMVTINFADKRIILERVGQNTTVPHVVDSTVWNQDANDIHNPNATTPKYLDYTYDVGGHDINNVWEDAPVFIKGGGYYDFVEDSYHATNDDGSVNDDVDYVKGTVVNNVFTITRILTYTYANGQLVETLTDTNGNAVSETINRADYRLRRKKISFPLQKATS